MRGKTLTLVAVAVILVGLLGMGGLAVPVAHSQGPWGELWGDLDEDFGWGGMMGGMFGDIMGGMGMMGMWGDFGPMFGENGFYAAPWGSPMRDIEPLVREDAQRIADGFVNQLGEGYRLGELMEFSNHFYGTIVEKDTDLGAYEFLMDRYTGAVYPKMGPNMMWNVKYGMMQGFGRSGMMGRGSGRGSDFDDLDLEDMDVTLQEAIQEAQDFLERNNTDLTVDEDVDSFYGYYTLHVLRDGQTAGMLSVNGFTGRVWPHFWHGDFIDVFEADDVTGAGSSGGMGMMEKDEG